MRSLWVLSVLSNTDLTLVQMIFSLIGSRKGPILLPQVSGFCVSMCNTSVGSLSALIRWFFKVFFFQLFNLKLFSLLTYLTKKSSS